MTWIEQRINQPGVAPPSTGTRSKKRVRKTRSDYDTDLLHDPLPGPNIPNTPERALWRAVLRQTLRDLHGRQKDRREALEWINTPNDEVRGFDWVCDILGIDPNAIRAMVRRQEEA